MKKIIFLDVDGVLNSQDWADEVWDRTGKSGWGGHFKENEVATKENVIWNEEMVENLRKIVVDTKAQIVISSTWRKFFSLEKFKEMFALYGWKDAPVIDKTPSGYKTRGLEINVWLKDYGADRYVILDDYPDFMPQQHINFVNTNPMVGLTKEDADKAIHILNQ